MVWSCLCLWCCGGNFAPIHGLLVCKAEQKGAQSKLGLMNFHGNHQCHLLPTSNEQAHLGYHFLFEICEHCTMIVFLLGFLFLWG